MPRRSRPAHRPARYFAKVPCQVVRERDFRLVADCVVDLSPGGALVGPADPVLTGERLIVSFPGLRGAWIDAEAVVARVVHGRRAGEHKRSLGLCFERLDAESSQALAQLLSFHLPTAPGARHERRGAPR